LVEIISGEEGTHFYHFATIDDHIYQVEVSHCEFVTWVSNGAVSSRKDGVVLHTLCCFLLFLFNFAAKVLYQTVKTCQYLKKKYKKNAENVKFSAFFEERVW
jgi:hypothetical protein